ncbi:CobW family GTP-binding protein [Halanaerobium hydrogeniformans]|uniref:Cobalamin synthesis protein P47K n=1 Tax=Halanaerobium hydrogeniformans TaxID=656519 RepID=E4RMD5_HALHG|nr:GTP-binding protein [Halanaerobium hydrogeniformans]ADQ14466.1 cobalamin synthesis protein P47K [Halanaerobium hydrogeniformans]
MPVKKINPNSKPIPLIIITGFLGSGKTTFLNNILNSLRLKKIGLIINEFGEINVDAELINMEGDSEISEINNGSIFCSCLSGSFINTLAKYQDLDLDYIFVESSGMSRPISLDKILDSLNTLTEQSFNYSGMICIVDALNINNLLKSVNSVKEQIAYSDLILINKTDLVDAKDIENAVVNIKMINEHAKIVETSFAKIDINLLENLSNINDLKSVRLDDNLSSENIIPENFLLKFEKEIKEQELEFFLNQIKNNIYRIKGFVKIKGGKTALVNSSRKEVEWSLVDNKEIKDSKLVVFAENKADISVPSSWK